MNHLRLISPPEATPRGILPSQSLETEIGEHRFPSPSLSKDIKVAVKKKGRIHLRELSLFAKRGAKLFLYLLLKLQNHTISI